MDRRKVAVMQCASYDTEELIRKIDEGVAILGGWGRWLKPGMNVLLKVNLIGPVPSESAAVTHCEFVRAMTRILKRQGCSVWVGDSAGGAIGGKAQTGKAFSVSGIEKVAAEEGAEIKNFDREGVVEVKALNGEPMYLAKPMFDADFVINLPKFKTHMAATYTGAVKNLFGCVPGQKKAEYHKAAPAAKPFGEILCGINKAVKAGLNIMDGVLAMDKQGPVSGEIYKAEKILLSEDPLALDTVAVEMIGLHISNLPTYSSSIEQCIGEWRMDHIEVCGDFNQPPKLAGFRVPKVRMKENGKGGNALGYIVDLMKTRPEMDLEKCKKCNVCVASCPVQAIDKETKKIDYSKCIECMCCHELCVYNAVKLVKANRVMRMLSHLKKQD